MIRRLFIILLFATAPALAMTTPVQDLPLGCAYEGTTCTTTYDSTSGVCRTVRFGTAAGEIQVLVCDKGAQYELYRQEWPSTGTFKACTGGGAIDQISGFSAFTSTTLPSGCPPVGDGTTPPTTTSPLVDPNSIGFDSKTRAENHATLVGKWWNDSRLVQRFDCGGKTCAWVPWYSSSTECTTNYLKPLSDCGGSGTADESNNCMVTDELSQVMLATAQGTSDTRMQELLNTVKLLASGTSGGRYGKLPAWRARRNGTTITLAAGTNRDTASDADARVLLALYVAARSPHFPQSSRDTYLAYANALAADFLQYDFRHECRPGRNGVQICDWLAAGGDAAGSFSSNPFGYAGYYGDVAIALLAAHKATGQAQYLDAARDTVNGYLLAANFNNSSFSVPYKAFRWDLSFTPQKAVCSGCPETWDYDDAPRATSLCKAQYYASLAGVTLPADLDTYCTAWMNSGGVRAYEYIIQYTLGGSPAGTFQDGPHENGLGASLNFHYSKPDLVTRLDRVGTKWNPTAGGWYGQNCHGVYRNAFFTVNLGSAIGFDMRAFAGQ